MPRKSTKKVPVVKEAELHKDLKGYDIKINEFGEMQSTMPIDRINEFLNKELHPPIDAQDSEQKK